ncbi:MAG TPA: transcriptional repressor [Patescibacteria group bacterium]|nr:transcriptional repressor [Patescibacteria group bacterium]
MDNFQNKYKWQKLTNQRTQILEFLQTNLNHPTAEEIHQAIRPYLARLSLSTIYRNLRSLESEGVVSSIKTPDRKIHFEHAGADHAHFYCLFCRKLIQLPLAEIIDIKKRLAIKNYQVQKVDIIFEGICPDCVLKKLE